MRNAVRVVVLLCADVLTFFVIRSAIELGHAGAWGARIATVSTNVFPGRYLQGWSFLVAMLLGLVIAGAYGSGDLRRDTGRVFGGVFLAGLFTLYPAAWSGTISIVGLQYVAAVLTFGLALKLDRWCIDQVVTDVGPIFGPSRVIVVGDTDASVDLPGRGHRLRGAPIRVVGSVGLCDDGGKPVGPNIDDLGILIHECRADTVIVRRPLTDGDFAYVVDQALASGCWLLAGSRTILVAGVEPRAVWVHGESFVELTAPHLQAWELAIKRFIDIVGATLGIVVLSPLMLAVAVAVRLDSPGPVLFRHKRLGFRGRTFRCFKFRSMRHDAERLLRADPTLYRRYVDNDFKLPEDQDPRITKVGRFLRSSSLDELPQLFNVLMGRMSLVGPRPIVPEELDHYGRRAPLFLSLKPGITGVWAVNGRSQVGYPARANMELEYIRRWSLLSDVSLLLRTVPEVVRRRGAH